MIMFAEYVFRKVDADYNRKLLLIDADGLDELTHYSAYFEKQGFRVIRFTDDLHFRAEHDEAMQDTENRFLLIAKNGIYIPYDIVKRFGRHVVSLSTLFPKLSSTELKEIWNQNYDLLTLAYQQNYEDLTAPKATLRFYESTVYGTQNIERYIQALQEQMREAVKHAVTYRDWFAVADIKAEIDLLSAKYEIKTDTEQAEEPFTNFILKDYGKLSTAMDPESPVLVSRAMEYMHDHSEKFAIIVMDGMSNFDWKILSESFSDVRYQKTDLYAMIPTTTSISRQCLLSNKYPSQLISPWTQSQEKKEFTDCALGLGYLPAQIGYERGYDADFSHAVKCAAVIINDVDDMVHGQKQGRIGMFNDITVLTKQKLLLKLTKRLLQKGFDVYITADHGNTPCTGTGKLIGTGVDVETKSRRMLVLKDFADKDSMRIKHDLIEYPKYYLNKSYDYLLCRAGRSFDSKGDQVMSHGSITIDEVIVPFITIKAGDNNG